ncbi:hypothetical protein BegalDRAFT_0897 [Beggiatoa alba B18LD]|uniref:Uncharacterized protein n=1 Tax=Beggiatoa alba B18LD TaxID=395493 RepID=I3CDW2_9GAMM|nr:hypothetical protein [Beggiatoa alba]EIJ41805.1 hypothetical protein BegalDRAFT_0897 [Beggiatoa alba B18LD]
MEMMYVVFFALIGIGLLTLFMYKRKMQELERERREKEMWLMQEIAIQQAKQKKAETTKQQTQTNNISATVAENIEKTPSSEKKLSAK